MTTLTRIALFGGAFDPVHNGHVALAALAHEYLRPSLLLFAPAGTPPHKRCAHAPARHRVAMLQLALEGLEGCALYRGEIRREGPSYTIDTVRELRREYSGAQILLIIGSDNLREIPAWHRYRELLGAVQLCVVHRPGYAVRRPGPLRHAPLVTVPSPQWGISSSMLRGFLRQGRSCIGLMPDRVREYIAAHRLYT